MTVAVCWKCGETKWGAFNACPKCKAAPRSEDDLALSLALSDHYIDKPTMERVGASITAGQQMQLAPETRRPLIEKLQESGLQTIAPGLVNGKRDESNCCEVMPWWRRILSKVWR